MASNTRQYYTLPTEAPRRSKSGNRRPPLTPSTVSSPCLTTYVPVASRRNSGSSGSPTKASDMLAKVVLSPTSSRVDLAAAGSVPPSETRMQSNPMPSPQKPAEWRDENDRYVREYKQQDGYVSFPDFENFHQKQNPYSQHREQTAVKT